MHRSIRWVHRWTRRTAVATLVMAIAGCAASTQLRSNTATDADRNVGALATLSLMGTLDDHPQGKGYQAACSAAFSQYYQANHLRGTVVSPTATSLHPKHDLKKALDRSQANALLVVQPVDTEWSPDQIDNEYSLIRIDASLYTHAQGRIWRADIALHPNTHIYWHGDKDKTCTRLVNDIFARLQQDSFHIATTATGPAPTAPSV